jgi:folate-binding protein YgfZ
LKLLSRFTMAGDFRVTDKTSETVELSVQGPRSVEIIRELFSQAAADTNKGRVTRVENSKGDILVIRASHTGEDGYDLIVPVELAEEIWDSLVALKAVPVGFEAFETLRIEAGEPRFGVDMTENHVVLETGLDDAVSFTKGCYIGQEIIARIHWRGHVAKRLSGLVLEQGEARRDDRILSVDGKEIGKVTSAVFSPKLGKGIALGYVKYDYLPVGTAVQIAREDGEELAAVVTELPIIRGTGLLDEKGGDGA